MTEPLFNKGDIVKHKHFDIRKQIIKVYEDEGGVVSHIVSVLKLRTIFIQKMNWFQSLTKLNSLNNPLDTHTTLAIMCVIN